MQVCRSVCILQWNSEGTKNKTEHRLEGDGCVCHCVKQEGASKMDAPLSVGVIAVVVALFFSGGCRAQCTVSTRPTLMQVNGSDPVIIVSPGYPNRTYPNNALCTWQLAAQDPYHVIHLYVVSLQLDTTYINCRSDFVDLYDGNYLNKEPPRGTPRSSRLCSDQYTRNYLSSSRYMYVRFVTDSTDVGRGFKFQVTSRLARVTVTTPFAVTSSTSIANDDSSGYDATPVIAAAVGGALGGLALLILIIVVIVLIGRCLYRAWEEKEEQSARSVVPIIVPTAPPPDEMPGRHGRNPPRGAVYQNSGAMLTNFHTLPGTPRLNGPAPRGDPNRSGSPRPGSSSRLEPPGEGGGGWNDFAGSPRGPAGSRGGGPDLDGRRHLDVPGDRGRRPEGGSREGSPGRGRDGSPWRGGGGGGGGGGSPRQGSPRPPRSPRDWGRPPSPRSPGGGRRDRPRSGSPPIPPPIPPPSHSGGGLPDAPPSYNEAVMPPTQPSAPPAD